MKTNILRISILPLVLLIALSFTGLQPQKENKGKGNNEQGQGNKGNSKGNNPSQGNNASQGNSSSKGNQNQDHGRSDSDHGRDKNPQSDNGNGNQGNNGNQKNDNKDARDKGHGSDNKGVAKDNGNGNGKGKSWKESIKWDRDENISWGFEDFSNRKRPGSSKKVTVCHNTGSEYPVTISISENALKAHINHGDQVGNCTVNYSDRWPANYIRTRENVYNSYENTWETMSYSEALLRFAADKLLGIKSTFQTQRPTLSQQEIERRELLIMELQNNVNSLENQLAVTRQRTDGININISL
jgi:hypothetical protein